MSGFVDMLREAGITLRVSADGRLQYLPATISDEMRAFLRKHREQILAELRSNTARATMSRKPLHATPTLAGAEVTEDEDDDPRAWWERPGFDIEQWLDRAERYLRFELVDGAVRRRPVAGTCVPMWVCSNAYQLEGAGVLHAALTRRQEALQAGAQPERPGLRRDERAADQGAARGAGEAA